MPDILDAAEQQIKLLAEENKSLKKKIEELNILIKKLKQNEIITFEELAKNDWNR